MSSLGEIELEWWDPGTVPAPGSIVWCNFPDHVAPGVPGPKARPALVFKVAYADDPPGDRFNVMVAYGTTKLKHGKRPHDFSINNYVLLDLVRLPAATRFDLDTFVWLPWAKPWFVPRKADDGFATPVVSVIPPELRRILGWTMAKRDELGLNNFYHGLKAPEPEP